MCIRDSRRYAFSIDDVVPQRQRIILFAVFEEPGGQNGQSRSPEGDLCHVKNPPFDGRMGISPPCLVPKGPPGTPPEGGFGPEKDQTPLSVGGFGGQTRGVPFRPDPFLTIFHGFSRKMCQKRLLASIGVAIEASSIEDRRPPRQKKW